VKFEKQFLLNGKVKVVHILLDDLVIYLTLVLTSMFKHNYNRFIIDSSLNVYNKSTL